MCACVCICVDTLLLQPPCAVKRPFISSKVCVAGRGLLRLLTAQRCMLTLGRVVCRSVISSLKKTYCHVAFFAAAGQLLIIGRWVCALRRHYSVTRRNKYNMHRERKFQRARSFSQNVYSDRHQELFTTVSLENYFILMSKKRYTAWPGRGHSPELFVKSDWLISP